jgi:hypothetical protein
MLLLSRRDAFWIQMIFLAIKTSHLQVPPANLGRRRKEQGKVVVYQALAQVLSPPVHFKFKIRANQDHKSTLVEASLHKLAILC